MPFFGDRLLKRGRLVSAAEVIQFAAVAFRGFSLGEEADGEEGLALFGAFQASFLALLSFAVEGLGDGGGSTQFAEGQDFDVKVTGFGFDVQGICDPYFARGFGGDIVRLNASEVAGFRG